VQVSAAAGCESGRGLNSAGEAVAPRDQEALEPATGGHGHVAITAAPERLCGNCDG
jgi:hypothetical protein